MGNLDLAIEDYNAALRIRPDFVEALYNRGYAYFLRGDRDRTIADWEAVLRIDPQHDTARRNLDMVRQTQRR
jgi:tetratricopeptide (TPR) repeat protein